jgi:hypothetical protein
VYFILQLAEKLFGTAAISAHRRAHRATRVASDMIERAGYGGGKAERSWRKYLWAGGRRGQTVRRWAGNLPGGAGTVRVTQTERQNELLACDVVCLEARGNEDLGAKLPFSSDLRPRSLVAPPPPPSRCPTSRP